MTEKDYSPLTTPCFRFLTDKMYEKRKQASLEIEKLVRNYNQKGNSTEIRKLLRVLGKDLIESSNPNYRKGGAIGLASMAVGLAKDSSNYSVELVQPIVSSLNDQDSRVRYYACEALFNVIKVIRTDILPLFNTVFDILSELTADPDQSVKSGAELIDRLLKDIVTETPSFDVSAFIPLLRERLYAEKPLAQRFVVSWVQFLNDLPDVDMLSFLPDLLEGLFRILSEVTLDIRQMTESVLSEFKGKMLADPSRVDFTAMVNILVIHSQAKEPLVQLIAITWLKEFVNLISQDSNKSKLLPLSSSLLQAILPCLESRAEDADDQRARSRINITEVAKALNHSLMQLVTRESQYEDSAKPDLSSIVQVLNMELKREENSPAIKIATLRWVYHLHTHVPDTVRQHVRDLFDALLSTLKDPSEEVAVLDLEVLAKVTASSSDSNSTGHDFFMKFIRELVNLFQETPRLLNDRGIFVIRQLCRQMSSIDIYKSFSEILLTHPDLKFAHLMVQTLNRILFSTPELFDLRQELKNLRTDESCSLFCTLYKTWSHSPVATISLCLLTQNYSHACSLVMICQQLDITLEFLSELDQLVQLIESPIFAFMRLHMLESQQNADLVKAMYGVLMLLPQGSSFHLLRKRLQCIPVAGPSDPPSRSVFVPAKQSNDNVFVFRQSSNSHPKMDLKELLRHFQEVQQRHQLFKRKEIEQRYDSTR